MLRDEAEKIGYEMSPDQAMAAVPTYVAETDKQAHREGKSAYAMAVQHRFEN